MDGGSDDGVDCVWASVSNTACVGVGTCGTTRGVPYRCNEVNVAGVIRWYKKRTVIPRHPAVTSS
eukprot:Gb_11709 [translate_table: standard]